MLKLILTDIDECVLQYHESFELWIRNNPDLLKEFNIEVPEPNSHLTLKQDMITWLQADRGVVNILVDLFARTEGFRNLSPGWESDIYIPLLYNMGYKFIAITSAGKGSVIKENRTQNLETYFPNMFTSIHCIEWEDSKENYLKLYKPAWWVEDRISNAKMGIPYCHRPFLINNSYNQGNIPAGIKRVSSWKSIFECITNDNCNLLGWMC